MKHQRHTKSLTYLYYGAIGSIASLILLLAFYWSLSRTSNLALLFDHPYSIPYYASLSVALTLGICIAFGVNVAFMVYRWRVYGSPFSIQNSTSSGAGAFLGLVASACPICGTTILSAIGVVGGLSVLPFQGLELKTISLALMVIPLWFLWKDTRKDCTSNACAVKQDHYIRPSELRYLLAAFASFGIILAVSMTIVSSDPLFTNDVSAAGYMCPGGTAEK
jgi:hypothetical protein